MVVSPEPSSLTEWAVGFLALFQERPQPRVGLHHGPAVERNGDYFGATVNLAARVSAMGSVMAGAYGVSLPIPVASSGR